MGWEYEKNCAYGKYQDYYVSVYQNINLMVNYDTYKAVVIPVHTSSEFQMEALDQYFKTNKRGMGVSQVIYSKGTYVFRVQEVMKTLSAEWLERILRIAVRGFK
ncbi:MAG TPA: hypothetical protein PKU69_02010, partial [Bacillota bacterium]|nr:hypothetical protein [Bacillota bacterium]